MLPNANGRLHGAFDPAVFSQQLAEAVNLCSNFYCNYVFQGVAAAFNGNFEQVFGSGFQPIAHGQGLHGTR